MTLSVILIEIGIMLLIFSILVFGMLLISPLTFISDYPPEIQAEYGNECVVNCLSLHLRKYKRADVIFFTCTNITMQAMIYIQNIENI